MAAVAAPRAARLLVRRAPVAIGGAARASAWRWPQQAAAGSVAAVARGISSGGDIGGAEENLNRHAGVRHLESRLHRIKHGGYSNEGYPDRRVIKWEPIGEEQRAIIRSLRQNLADLDWQGALEALRAVPAEPGVEWNPVFRAVLQCCCRALRPEEARAVFGQMPERDIKAYNMLLHMYCQLQRIEEMDRLRAQMDADGIGPSAVTHLAMLKAWSQLGMWEEAVGGLEALKVDAALGANVNWEVAYLSAINACARAGFQHQRARELFDELKARMDVRVHQSHYNALLGAHRHSPEEARRVFDEMRRAGFAARVRDWCTLMFCYRFDWEGLVEVYKEMKRDSGAVADDDVFVQVLLAARQQRDPEGMRWAMEEMAAVGVDPRREGALPALRQAFLSVEEPRSEGAWQPAAAVAAASPPSGGAPLPQGWASAVDPVSGRSYYWLASDPASTTTWHRPPPAAPAAPPLPP